MSDKEWDFAEFQNVVARMGYEFDAHLDAHFGQQFVIRVWRAGTQEMPVWQSTFDPVVDLPDLALAEFIEWATGEE